MLQGSGDGEAISVVPGFKSSKVKQLPEVEGLKMKAWVKFVVMAGDPA
jgi:hypothetical protein